MTCPPRVTIMIPTYGQESVILEAVDSALQQDYPNLEVIVADDASPDRTAAVVATRTDPRLRYHRNAANLGRVGNYRHTLYHLATGDWVVNLDGDDYYTDPHFISTAMTLVQARPDLVIVGARHVGQPCLQEHRGDGTGPLIVPGVELLKVMDDPWFAFSHLGTLYHREKAMACDFYRRDVLSSDWESLYRLALRGQVAFLHQCVGIWRRTETSASQSTDWQTLFDNMGVWESIGREAVELGHIDDAFARKRSRVMHRISGYHGLCRLLRSGQIKDAWRLWSAIRGIDAASALRLALDYRIVGRLLLAVFRTTS